ncbi:protein kinase [Streptomyces sp. NPDC006012]|uniref:protein kinase domain-containing protein n=1 Tax=Streptomyces sp. NPDC006012 TaxID=3364739 RepID=UPI0036A7B757
MEKLGPGDPRDIGAYRLLARLGAGGMGHVYLARSGRGRTVAVKLVRPELARMDKFRARFRQEVQAARQVGGLWTAPVLDADTEADVPWVATGYVAGPSLQQVVGHDHGALPERSVRILAAGLAQALQDIHAAGIVHRDLKPSNVLVTIDGPRVIDFGIARALESVGDEGLTTTGSLVGSPGFMAPEQVRGDRITPACDVFCLGSVLSYAATGALPFGGTNGGAPALMFRIAQEEPDLVGVPESLADLIRECLRKDPAARPTLDRILAQTGAGDTVADGRSRDPWLPASLVVQLGRHAVQLLDTEDPADGPVPGAGPADGPAAGAGPVAPSAREPATPAPGASPEHATAAPPRPSAPGGPPPDHLRTLPADRTPPPDAPAAHPAYGPPGGDREHGGRGEYSEQGAPGIPGASGENSTPGAFGAPPAYGTPGAPAPGPYGTSGGTAPGSYGRPRQPHPPQQPHHQSQQTQHAYRPYPPNEADPEPERRGSRATVLLVVIALVVALAAGGSVYAVLKQGGTGDATGGDATATDASTAGKPSPAASGDASSPPADGAVPDGYLGTWRATIDNANGSSTRELTIAQGKVGDPVLTLAADGPVAGGGSYHCEFRAPLAEQPGSQGPLQIGPSTVSSGEPATSCRPGAATEITLLSDGRLRRTAQDGGETLTYTRG